MGRRTTTKRRQNSGIGSLMLSFVTFILGYLVASAFDMSHLSHWMTSRFTAQTNASNKSSMVKTAELPKPKFEFYTLLTKDRTTESMEIASTAASQPSPKSALVANPAATTNVTSMASPAPKAESAPLDLTVTQKLPLHAPLVAMAPPPSVKTVANPEKIGRYIIQVGSFKNLHEAEKMKAVLAMRGFSPVITSMTQQQITWYRVLIGPFSSLTDAQRVHREFAERDRIAGMIRKLDV